LEFQFKFKEVIPTVLHFCAKQSTQRLIAFTAITFYSVKCLALTLGTHKAHAW